MVVSQQRLGGWMIAGAFLVYMGLAMASWHTESNLSLLTIAGTLLLYAGAKRIVAAQGQPPAIMVAVGVTLVAGFVTGLVANGLPGDTPQQMHTYSYAMMAQGLAFTVAGILVFVRNGSTAVRALCGIALLGNVLAALFTINRFDALVVGALSYDEFIMAGTWAQGLDNLAVLPAVVFALTAPAQEQPLSTGGQAPPLAQGSMPSQVPPPVNAAPAAPAPPTLEAVPRLEPPQP